MKNQSWGKTKGGQAYPKKYNKKITGLSNTQLMKYGSKGGSGFQIAFKHKENAGNAIKLFKTKGFTSTTFRSRGLTVDGKPDERVNAHYVIFDDLKWWKQHPKELEKLRKRSPLSAKAIETRFDSRIVKTNDDRNIGRICSSCEQGRMQPFNAHSKQCSNCGRRVGKNRDGTKKISYGGVERSDSNHSNVITIEQIPKLDKANLVFFLSTGKNWDQISPDNYEQLKNAFAKQHDTESKAINFYQFQTYRTRSAIAEALKLEETRKDAKKRGGDIYDYNMEHWGDLQSEDRAKIRKFVSGKSAEELKNALKAMTEKNYARKLIDHGNDPYGIRELAHETEKKEVVIKKNLSKKSNSELVQALKDDIITESKIYGKGMKPSRMTRMIQDELSLRKFQYNLNQKRGE